MKKYLLVIAVTLIGLLIFSAFKMNKNDNNKKEIVMKTIQLTKSEFLTKVMDFEKNPQTWKYLGDKPAIIDFYATWCGPCKSLAPVLEDLAAEYDGQIYIYKVDVDKERELAGVFGVQSIPTLLFIPMNGEPSIMQGAQPKASLKESIESILLKKRP
jgi:thioredoxin